MSKIRIGFVGVGSMGQAAHLQSFVTVPECQVVALAEIRPKMAAAVAARYGVPRVYATGREMLAAEELDGIVASQQFTKHASIVPELLTKGVPVLTEKPLAGSIASGEKILSGQAASKGKLYIGYHKRSDPATMRVKRQIAGWHARGQVGRMKYVRISMPPGDWVANGFIHNVNTDEPYPPLADDAAPSDMDPTTFRQYLDFVNFYIHQVNLLRHLLGEDYRVRYADPSGVLMAVQSDSGVCGSLEMATHSTTIDWQEQAFVAFERGWIKLDLPAPLTRNRAGKVTIFTDAAGGAEPTTVEPTLPWINAMRQQAMNFVAAARGEKIPLCEAPEALRDLQVARDYLGLFKAANQYAQTLTADGRG
jgi:predicted dehydrogenase